MSKITTRLTLPPNERRATITLPELEWIAQTIHQAYHGDYKGGWSTCDKTVCLFIAEVAQRK